MLQHLDTSSPVSRSVLHAPADSSIDGIPPGALASSRFRIFTDGRSRPAPAIPQLTNFYRHPVKTRGEGSLATTN
jgi:hypothetical protein